MKKHSKHTKLTQRKNGFFATNEISFAGSKCNIIDELVHDISEMLFEKIKICYVDASHNKEEIYPKFDVCTYHSSWKTSILRNTKSNNFNDRILFSQYDLVCVNGNHYTANQQVVILDPEKENSVFKRINNLNNIKFFIKKSKNASIFKVLKEKYPSYEKLPIYDLEDIKSITNHVEKIIKENNPILNGLVLIGGKSTRMGLDKSLLKYHGLPQRDHIAQLLEEQGLETFLSVIENQKIENRETITDSFTGLGPFGAICSAFMKNPNKAYLVLATDLPFVNKQLIKLLISKRNPKKTATAVKGKTVKFVEPLITIWEPKAYPVLLNHLSQGYSCPKKVLINSEVEIVEVENKLIQNINTREEFERTKKKQT